MASSSQSRLLPILIALLGLGFGYFYNSQIDIAAQVEPIDLRYQPVSLRSLDNLKIDYSVLQDDQFKQLKVFGDLPVVAPAGGKSNPFQ